MLKDESGSTATESDNGLIVIPEGQRPPWTQIAEQFLGKNEIDDEDELREFLGFNPNDQDADGLAWCKGFVDSCHKKCGIEYPSIRHSSLPSTTPRIGGRYVMRIRCIRSSSSSAKEATRDISAGESRTIRYLAGIRATVCASTTSLTISRIIICSVPDGLADMI